MYKHVRHDTACLKRLHKQVFRAVLPRREPLCAQNIHALSIYSVKRRSGTNEHQRNILYLSLKKWVLAVNKSSGNGSNFGIRSTRQFSGSSDNRKNVERKNSVPSSEGQGNKDSRENTVQKPIQKPFKAAGESENAHDRISKADNTVQQRNQDLNPESEGKPNISKKTHRKERSGKGKLSITGTTNSTKTIEDFDRLQILKGRLIKKLDQQWLFCENIVETLENFPYYLSENTRDLLLESIVARLKNHELTKYGECLPGSSNLIVLQGQPGSERYQETLIKAVAQHLQVSLMVVDSSILSGKGIKDDVPLARTSINEREKNDNKIISWKNRISVNNLNQVSNAPLESTPLHRLGGKCGLPKKLHYFSSKRVDVENHKEFIELDNDRWAEEMKKLVVTGREEELKKLGKQGEELKKLWHDLIIGDHVRYKGPKISKESIRPKVCIGQEGFVSSISDSLPWKVCVRFQSSHGLPEADEVFCDAADLEKINSSVSDESWIARFPELPIEALCKMVVCRGPAIVYFPDLEQWLSNASISKGKGLLLKRVKDSLTKVEGPVVFIASKIKEDTNKPPPSNSVLDSIFPSIVFEKVTEPEESDKVFKMFKNNIKILPPEEPRLLHIWQKKLAEDKNKVRQRRNLLLLKENLEQHDLCCPDLAGINTLDLDLTQENVEDVIGWARNMAFKNKRLQIKDGKLIPGKECFEKSILRLKSLKARSEEKICQLKELAENEYEKSCLSSIVLAHDISVKFDQIGALDDVKRTLDDLIVLPLRRPELFRRGNLRKPCKGVLLFGPPGTGKTLIAKAVATEAGANFINLSASSITSKYYGDDEKLVKAVFSLAKKLSPVVIFIDEVDSLLGVRGGASEHEATRRIKNEFMACWDGLQSRENEQILVFATTNRPFDLDDAVIRRLPRRLFIDLPNQENRAKILRVILENEDLQEPFDFDILAAETEGYSGSDLKNLCVAAAYVPIRELLSAEQQEREASEDEKTLMQTATALRPLRVEDFIQAKRKVGNSVAYDAATMIQMRQWNEQYGEGGQKSQITFGFSKK